MWLVAEYQPVGLFSLKHASATSSGGKSLLVPTPFALKMALLDGACRLWGVSEAEAIWPVLRDLPVGLSEWAVHPGLADSELLAIEPGGAPVRQADLDFLTSAKAREVIQQEGITLLSYKPLQEVWQST